MGFVSLYLGLGLPEEPVLTVTHRQESVQENQARDDEACSARDGDSRQLLGRRTKISHECGKRGEGSGVRLVRNRKGNGRDSHSRPRGRACSSFPRSVGADLPEPDPPVLRAHTRSL